MTELREMAIGAAIGAISFFAASIGRLGKHLESMDHFSAAVVVRHLGLQLTLMPAAAALAGWLVATQGWNPLSMIPMGLAAGWGGFAVGDLLYTAFMAMVSRMATPKD